MDGGRCVHQAETFDDTSWLNPRGISIATARNSDAEGSGQASHERLVREFKAKSGMEIWRRDDKIGQAWTLGRARRVARAHGLISAWVWASYVKRDNLSLL
jgi:hypothetical protein